jgi:hypothetical protein
MSDVLEAPKKVKKHVYRVGDKVRILRPNWIERVGYPLIWTDLIDEVEADPRTHAALAVLGVPGFYDTRNSDPAKIINLLAKSSKMPRDFVRAVAMQRVEERGFGGKERQLIYEKPLENLRSIFDTGMTIRTSAQIDYTGWGMTIISKRNVKTGTYFPPSGGVHYGYDGAEDWYEPGGLDNAKTHVLLTLDRGEISTADVEPW